MFNTYVDDHTLSEEAAGFLASFTNNGEDVMGWGTDCDVCGFCDDCDNFEHCVFCYHGDVAHSGEPTKVCADWELENCYYCSDE